jgi:flagellar motor switch protein FliM
VGDEGSDSRIAVDISLSILLTAINRMLGGSLRDAPLPARPLTQIEQTLSGRFVDRVSRELQVVLGGESTAVWKADPVAEYPDHAEVPSSTKTVMSIDFAVQMGSTCGLLRFAIPWSLLEQAARGHNAGATRIGESAGPEASVQLSAVIARWQLSPTELGDLQVGNVIEMDADVGAAIEVELNGNLRFYASPGALRGHRAVKIERVADPL